MCIDIKKVQGTDSEVLEHTFTRSEFLNINQNVTT